MRNTSIRHTRENSIFQDTSIELKVKKMLDELNINYEHPYVFKNSISCDFTILALKLIIECDGCYWHSCPKHHPKARITNDKERDKYTAYFGWKTLRLWEHDINNDLEKCYNTIKDTIFMRSRTLSNDFL